MNWKQKTVYQIYPKSFCDSNQDGVGDLNGITSKLPYLHELGIDVLWIAPFFVSPQNDNGYDIAEYRQVDPRFGTMEDFENLCKKAKELQIAIMLDMVFNHTSTNHIWFQKALQNDSKYKEYYIFKKGKANKVPPNNWMSKFGGDAWEYVEALDEYYLHLFDKTQADLNWENPEVRKELADIVNFWREKGVRGFRFDVVNLISKGSFEDDPNFFDGRQFYTDGPHVHEYLKELNLASFGQDEGIMTVGEMSNTNIDHCALYSGANAHELSSVFSFHHLKVDYRNKNKWELMEFDFLELKEILNTWQVEMQKQDAWNALFWCNHDQPRALSRFGNDHEYRNESAKMLATTVHLMRGTPYVYQGEELGMRNAYFTNIQDYRDVESLNYFQILKNQGLPETEIHQILQARSRDNGRTPMQWDNTKHAGFSICEPWIKVNEDYLSINAAQELQDEQSVFHYYKKLIALRKQYHIISEGTYEPYLSQDLQLFAYKRHYRNEEVLVLNNFYATPYALPPIDIQEMQILLSNYEDCDVKNTLILRPYESVVLYIKWK